MGKETAGVRRPGLSYCSCPLVLLHHSILVRDPTPHLILLLLLIIMLKKSKKKNPNTCFVLLSWAICIAFVVFKQKALGSSFTNDTLKRLVFLFLIFVAVVVGFCCCRRCFLLLKKIGFEVEAFIFYNSWDICSALPPVMKWLLEWHKQIFF